MSFEIVRRMKLKAMDPTYGMTVAERRHWLTTDEGLQWLIRTCPTGTGETGRHVAALFKLRQEASRAAWNEAIRQCVTMYDDVANEDEREILQFTWCERQLVSKGLTPPTYGDIALCDTCDQFVFHSPGKYRTVEIECCDYCMEGA